MASSSSHPRRRPQKATGSSVTPADSPKMSLRKGNTFSLRTKSAEPVDPFEVAAFLPKRSPTDPKSLELLINDHRQLNSHQQDVVKLLKQFDDQFYRSKHAVTDASILSEKDVLAVPTFMVGQVIVADPMDIDKKPIVDHHHGSDSGIGSSATSSHDEHPQTRPGNRASSRSSIISTHTTITKSASSLGNPPDTSHFLSPEAIRHIKKHIIQPILREPALKDFHPLIEDIPRRIGAKFIANLRDLEKTLFFLAPDFSKSPKSFLRFCETSIQCLHTTVDLLCEKDQRRPTDRPYTNNYFIDLVEQIRRYAEIMARTREKEAKGEALDDMDYSPDEEISLEGGLSNNGKPAELVRKKNGKVIPLSEHSNLLSSPESASKRPLADDEMDDDVLRSMARRRKSDRPGDIMHPCRVCEKEFKRPCDLTKHEKTHSRPWKCPDASCRYHDLGWPTEKERDRHVNDKHSSSPTMYKCKFPPCTYASKRESNCKQHMEKAHGWEYVRSKSNGRKKNGITTGGSSGRTPATPLTPFIATPASDSNHLTTPETPFAPSPSVPVAENFFSDFRFTPAPSHENLFGLGEMRRESITTTGSGGNYSSDMSPDQPLMTSFEDAVSPNDVGFDNSILGGNATFNFDFGGNQFQQPTPALSTGNNFADAMDFGGALGGSSSGNSVPHLSPTGQGDVTLYSPPLESMNFDEGLGDDMNFGQDFTLFDSAQAGPSGFNSSSNVMNWAFPDNSGVGGQFDQYSFGEQGFADPSMMFPQ